MGNDLSHKSLQQMQKEVHTYINQFEEGYFSPLALLARLSEEVGELAREINHVHGEKPKKLDEEPSSIEEEMGDILFVLLCFANSLHIDLEQSFQTVMKKFETRDENRWTKKKVEGEQNETN